MYMNEKLETLKKELIDNADSFVTESAKEAVVNWLKDAGVPAMKEVADVYIAKVKEQSQSESGWNKFRDGIFLPGLCDMFFYVVGKILNH